MILSVDDRNPSQIKEVNGSGDNRMPKGELWRVSVSTPSRYVDSPHPKKTPDPVAFRVGVSSMREIDQRAALVVA